MNPHQCLYYRYIIFALTLLICILILLRLTNRLRSGSKREESLC